ncbi:MAG: arsenate reductase (glutaredoxin) [Pseudomonadota bacterium]
MTVTIFHNPRCSTSRATLELIRAAGVEPTIVEYLKTGWTRDQLTALLARMGAGPRAILREREALASDLGLTDPAASDETILEAMVAHPVLVQRPIVATERGVVLGRPPETVHSLIGG